MGRYHLLGDRSTSRRARASRVWASIFSLTPPMARAQLAETVGAIEQHHQHQHTPAAGDMASTAREGQSAASNWGWLLVIQAGDGLAQAACAA
jgi:hypothetical protein